MAQATSARGCSPYGAHIRRRVRGRGHVVPRARRRAHAQGAWRTGASSSRCDEARPGASGVDAE
eukprot:CAMPEP_0183434704 /NCGR_PEP_ID=MMETSP0370-20130417/64437_1 /TAXON_ID=268820 /ORGANISM="Peridinium aciculiferum, Strain PAER-2" /LENGTH=63 /DNA_ID=CAMNT_0025621479 /DNA_START=190 /DNA_END=378 /DNA_ORIENTATION=-